MNKKLQHSDTRMYRIKMRPTPKIFKQQTLHISFSDMSPVICVIHKTGRTILKSNLN